MSARVGRDPVLVLASRVGPDEKCLLTALRRGGHAAEVLDTNALHRAASGPAGPGGLVLNREIGQVRARYAATMLEAAGMTVVNSAAAVQTCGDKWLTSLALARAGLPAPRTVLAASPAAAGEAAAELGFPVVLKPLIGSWGRLVTRVRDAEEAATVLEHVAAQPSPQAQVVYLQEYVDKPGHDLRALVVRGEVVAAMRRYADDWRTNVSRGGRSEPCVLDPDTEKLAVRAAEATGADIAGVDLAEDRAGAVLVLEVNHRVEFAGLQRAHDGLDIAGTIVDRIAGGAS
ncbi:RimK family alpha-L-glutamate ligase [Plantactinospora sp. ZYX-F-223]|uniref:RimK family alpha-L-glutamate ligase n=1 Tax=Plantactinospora sp. ZYX-F-223 TaxID=3144103 RepID=UPI0031FCE791